jgi:DNA-binding transcriptional LysR family regulator
MQSPLDSDRLLAFVTVARERGFSRAARVLGKTQSAVSQAVIQLEGELSQRLFVRDGKATRLTDAGVVLLEHAERVLEDMAQARERLAELGELRSGQLVIGATDTLACYFLPPVLAAFRARYPGVELRLDNRPSPATAVAVAERRVDVGVVALPLPTDLEARGRPIRERVQIDALAPYKDVVICPPDHALVRRRGVRVADLAGVPLLLLDQTTGTRAFLDAAFERAGVRPLVQMEMSSVEVLKRLVELGFGVSVVPAVSVEREVRARALVAMPLAGARRGRSVGLVTPASGQPSRAGAAFVEVAREEARARA